MDRYVLSDCSSFPPGRDCIPLTTFAPFPLWAKVGSARTLRKLWHTQRFAQADRIPTNPEFEREMGVPLSVPFALAGEYSPLT